MVTITNTYHSMWSWNTYSNVLWKFADKEKDFIISHEYNYNSHKPIICKQVSRIEFEEVSIPSEWFLIIGLHNSRIENFIEWSRTHWAWCVYDWKNYTKYFDNKKSANISYEAMCKKDLRTTMYKYEKVNWWFIFDIIKTIDIYSEWGKDVDTLYRRPIHFNKNDNTWFYKFDSKISFVKDILYASFYHQNKDSAEHMTTIYIWWMNESDLEKKDIYEKMKNKFIKKELSKFLLLNKDN